MSLLNYCVTRKEVIFGASDISPFARKSFWGRWGVTQKPSVVRNPIEKFLIDVTPVTCTFVFILSRRLRLCSPKRGFNNNVKLYYTVGSKDFATVS